MDIQKELIDCNNWILDQDDDFVTGYGQGNYALGLARLAWQAAKAQAVPEGFVLVPTSLSDEQYNQLEEVMQDNFGTTVSQSRDCITKIHNELVLIAQEPAND